MALLGENKDIVNIEELNLERSFLKEEVYV